MVMFVAYEHKEQEELIATFATALVLSSFGYPFSGMCYVNL